MNLELTLISKQQKNYTFNKYNYCFYNQLCHCAVSLLLLDSKLILKLELPLTVNVLCKHLLVICQFTYNFQMIVVQVRMNGKLSIVNILLSHVPILFFNSCCLQPDRMHEKYPRVVVTNVDNITWRPTLHRPSLIFFHAPL